MSNSIRDDNIRQFLRDLHKGVDPKPLRSYLTWEEAKLLTQQYFPGRELFKDMNVAAYGGKHAAAIEEPIRQGMCPRSWDFWHLARLTFLELGGCYLSGMQPVHNEIATIQV